MNRNYLFLIVLQVCICCFLPSAAQVLSPQWSFQVGGIGSDRGGKLMADPFGNIYFAGTIGASACINGSTDTVHSLGREDILLLRISPEGQLLWKKHLGGNGTDAPSDVMVNASGEVFLSGIFEDTIHFGTLFLSAKDYIDSFIAKYDSSGNLMWLRQMAGLNSEHGVTMTCDAQGNLLCGGFFAGTLEFPGQTTDVMQSDGGYDGFLAEWSPEGDLLRTWQITGPDDCQVNDVLADNNNTFYVIGTFSGTVIPDTLEAFCSVGGQDAFIARYDHQGELLWFETMGSIFDDNAKCLTLGGNNDMILMGEFREKLYHGNKMVLTAEGGEDIFQLKFNEHGKLQQNKKHGLENNDFVFNAWIPVGQKIMMASDLKIYEGNRSLALANYEMMGDVSDIYQTSDDLNPLILSAVMPDPDTIYFCGNFHDTVVFDQLTLHSNGQEDLFIIKLAPGQDSIGPLKRDHADTLVFLNPPMAKIDGGELTVYSYPNPFSGSTRIYYYLPQTCNVHIEILDIKGNVIRDQEFPGQSAGNHTLDIDGQQLKTGIYYCGWVAVGETLSALKVIKLICFH
ncbi:MAG TPA: T9SS type A sorting domain-containing protein [Bacteroidales bacterium]|nr:T9SS type A sorting domain-containing protein [Bacteroidales bacterium]HRZ20762.1 T9SS type A sorting domain-containing protein [Bacteroidales bacterium]